MAYRFTNTDKWSDAWFIELRPIEKLLFNYLCDNCDIAGFIELTPKKYAYDIGCNKSDIEGALKGLQRGLTVSNSVDCLYINNFLKHQKNLPLNENNKAHLGIIRRFNMYSQKFDIQNITKFIEGASKGLQSPIGIGIGIGIGKSIPEENKFIIFWDKYHSIINKPKTDKNPALKKWNKLNNKEKQLAINKIEVYSKTNDHKYLKKARTYLEDKTFNDEMKESKDEFLEGLRKLYNEANKHDKELLNDLIVPALMQTKHIKNTKFDVTYKQLYEVCSLIWNYNGSPKALESMFNKYDKDDYNTFKNVLFDIKKYMTN